MVIILNRERNHERGLLKYFLYASSYNILYIHEIYFLSFTYKKFPTKLVANVDRDICIIILLDINILFLVINYYRKMAAQEINHRSKLFVIQDII